MLPCLVIAMVGAACGSRTGLDDLSNDASLNEASADASRDRGLDAFQFSDTPTPDVGIFDAPVILDAPIDTLLGPPGCADGTREGFTDGVMYPDIAGCSGGFSIPGVMPFNPGKAPACPTYATHDSVTPACNRGAGNDGANPTGNGCNVADLCQAGWHVCNGSNDVTARSKTGCQGATKNGDPQRFFVTRQSSNGCEQCATGARQGADCNSTACTTGCAPSAGTSNDVFGCGNFGVPVPVGPCAPLDRFTNNLCGGLPNSGWSCTDDGSGLCEAYAIVHTQSTFGGAACCRD